MAMDLALYKSILKDTLDVIALDESGNIIKQSNEIIKTFFESDATSLSDDEKAKQFTSFMTNTVTSAINQAIMQAGTMAISFELDKPLKDQQIASMVIEDGLKQAKNTSDIAVNTKQIESMGIEDLVKKTDSASNLAKVKAEVEQLIPSQVAKYVADTDISIKELALKQYELDEMLPIQKEKLAVEKSKLESDVLLSTKEIELKGKEIDLKDDEGRLREAEIDLKRQELNASIETILLEYKRFGLMMQELGIKIEDSNVQRELVSAQSELARQQGMAVMGSLEVQSAIELNRNQKDVEVAEIYVGAR